MRVLGIDFESTGLDTSKDRITEIGAVLWDTEKCQPLRLFSTFVHDDTYPSITREIAGLTGITNEILAEFGYLPAPAFDVLERLCKHHGVSYIVAQNGTHFDHPLLVSELIRNGVEAPALRAVPWIDTRLDIPYRHHSKSGHLNYVAADHGILNPFKHRALFDVLTMLSIVAQYKFEDILIYRALPSIHVRIMIPTPWSDNGVGKNVARMNGYQWEEVDGRRYEKCWVKRIKDAQFDAEVKKVAPYPVVILL